MLRGEYEPCRGRKRLDARMGSDDHGDDDDYEARSFKLESSKHRCFTEIYESLAYANINTVPHFHTLSPNTVIYDRRD